MPVMIAALSFGIEFARSESDFLLCSVFSTNPSAQSDVAHVSRKSTGMSRSSALTERCLIGARGPKKNADSTRMMCRGQSSSSPPQGRPPRKSGRHAACRISRSQNLRRKTSLLLNRLGASSRLRDFVYDCRARRNAARSMGGRCSRSGASRPLLFSPLLFPGAPRDGSLFSFSPSVPSGGCDRSFGSISD